MSNRLINIIAAGLFVFVFIITVFSMKDDSLTSDELVHLPAGYSYVSQKNMQLNPEHPPLIKDLAGIPLLFVKDIKFPSQTDAWQKNVNDQWEFGSYFLYRMGNPVDKMVFWGRMPMVLILILFGYYVFRWTKELFGNKTGLLALFLFSLSPTLLAHGRLVTTDVGAAAGAFIASYYFIKFLKNSSRKNLIIAGVVLGIAQLTKFSLFLLFPFFGILIVIWAIIKSSKFTPLEINSLRDCKDGKKIQKKQISNGVKTNKSLTGFKEFLKTFGRYFISYLLICLIAFLVIWVVYQYHTWNYPPEKQLSDTESILTSFKPKLLSDLTVRMADKPILRPIAHYLLGLFMTFQRTGGGDVVYFLGEVSGAGWKSYFPIVYIIKESLTLHILTIIALLYLAWLINPPPLFRRKSGGGPVEPWKQTKKWLQNHFSEFAMLFFIGIYWLTTLMGNLNIGVRHLLPTFPFVFLLVSGIIIKWLDSQPSDAFSLNPLKRIKKLKYVLLSVLIVWQAVSVIKIYPHFLAYFNEIAGGPDKAYIYAVDSNLDWGQDLKRLSQWAGKKGIDKIYVDYSGGYDTRYYSAEKYYLKEKHVPWWGTRDPKEMPKGSYFAVSAFFLQRGRGTPAPDLNQPTGYYHWLDKYAPIAKIGYSIFVYYID